MRLGEQATAALEAGLALSFEVEWRLADGRRLHQPLGLRHSPLLRSYQLSLGVQSPRPYPVRDALLAAMENARLRWNDAPGCVQACGGEVRVRLDPAALPAPLRLPALIEGEWDFDSGWKQVEDGAAGTPHAARDERRDTSPARASGLARSVAHLARIAHTGAKSCMFVGATAGSPAFCVGSSLSPAAFRFAIIRDRCEKCGSGLAGASARPVAPP